jgi:hypothetical protein
MSGSTSSSLAWVKSGMVMTSKRERKMLTAPTTKKGNMKPPISYNQAPTPGPERIYSKLIITDL